MAVTLCQRESVRERARAGRHSLTLQPLCSKAISVTLWNHPLTL
jgi:hypothetical protein